MYGQGLPSLQSKRRQLNGCIEYNKHGVAFKPSAMSAKKTQQVVLTFWHTINSINDLLMNSTKSSFTNSLLQLQLECVIKPLKTSYPNYNLRVLPVFTSVTIFLHFQLSLVIKIQYLSLIITAMHTKDSSETIEWRIWYRSIIDGVSNISQNRQRNIDPVTSAHPLCWKKKLMY